MSELDLGLSSKMNEFATKFTLGKNHDEDILFENFSNYVVVSNLLEDELEDINKISTNKAQGIDGIGIFVNNRLFVEESDLETLGAKEKLKIKIGFIQSTIQSSFCEKKFKSFVDAVTNFLSDSVSIEPFSTILNTLLSKEGDYIGNIAETPLISLYFLSAKTNHALSKDFLNNEKTKYVIERICQIIR